MSGTEKAKYIQNKPIFGWSENPPNNHSCKYQKKIIVSLTMYNLSEYGWQLFALNFIVIIDLDDLHTCASTQSLVCSQKVLLCSDPLPSSPNDHTPGMHSHQSPCEEF